MNSYLFLNQQRPLPFISNGHTSLAPLAFMNLTSQPQANFQIPLCVNPLENLLNTYETSLGFRLQSFYPSQQNTLSRFFQEKASNENYINLQKEQIAHVEVKNNLGEIIQTKIESALNQNEGNQNSEPKQNFLSIEEQVQEMLNFIITKHGKIEKKELFYQNLQYRNNPILLNLFKALIDKFDSAAKNKEDMTRFVLRKALTCLRDSLREEQKLSAKAASVVLCKKYFSTQLEEFANMSDEELAMDDDEILNLLLPYKKNSRNRTANTQFTIEIFASQVFYQDYLIFLDKFHDILNEENQKRVKKFLEFLISCAKGNKIHLVKKFRRLPWLDVWVESTEKIAKDLLNAKSWSETNKKPRIRRKRSKY